MARAFGAIQFDDDDDYYYYLIIITVLMVPSCVLCLYNHGVISYAGAHPVITERGAGRVWPIIEATNGKCGGRCQRRGCAPNIFSAMKRKPQPYLLGEMCE